MKKASVTFVADAFFSVWQVLIGSNDAIIAKLYDWNILDEDVQLQAFVLLLGRRQ